MSAVYAPEMSPEERSIIESSDISLTLIDVGQFATDLVVNGGLKLARFGGRHLAVGGALTTGEEIYGKIEERRQNDPGFAADFDADVEETRRLGVRELGPHGLVDHALVHPTNRTEGGRLVALLMATRGNDRDIAARSWTQRLFERAEPSVKLILDS